MNKMILVGLLMIILQFDNLAFSGNCTLAENNKNLKPDKILATMKKVANWQLANPTGKALNTWDYAPFYAGLMSLYKLNQDKQYMKAIIEMGETVKWQTRPRPYDANVLCISQVFLELYEQDQKEKFITNTRYVMDATMMRDPWIEVRVDLKGNPYWWEWWTWCDALFMAPPTYARMASITGQEKYMDFMIQRWKMLADYIYSPQDSLFFRDDSFFDKRSGNGEKVFWSRGNGWVVAGQARVMEYLPKNHKTRPYFEEQFRAMCARIADLQMEDGFWGQSLYDTEYYPQRESSGTGFFVYAMAYGVNNGLLDKEVFVPVIEKGWGALMASIHSDGKFGNVQEVGDSPTDVSFDDSESYGTGAFLLAGVEVYKLMKGN